MGESALWGLLVFGVFLPSYGDEHSLYYRCTSQSKHSDSIHEFTAVTLLDDIQIDSYNSKDGIRTPKQDWVKKINGGDWERGTTELKNNGQYLNNLLNTQMMVFGHSETSDHILHWEYGCEVEEHLNGLMTVLSFTNKYSYDGQTLISYDRTLQLWSTSVKQASETQKKWNAEHHQNNVLQTCVDWLKIYLRKSPEIEKKPPEVYMFIDSPPPGPKEQILTCVATGFYPKDIKMILRKSGDALPEHWLKSSGVRPNGDGTYHLNKTVEVRQDQMTEYDCYVTHSSLKDPIIEYLRVHWGYWLLLSLGILIAIFFLLCLCATNSADAAAVCGCCEVICSCMELCI